LALTFGSEVRSILAAGSFTNVISEPTDTSEFKILVWLVSDICAKDLADMLKPMSDTPHSPGAVLP
jgi:hypothetical protein